MKVKITKSKAGETRVDYINIPDKPQFRFRLLKKIIEDFDNNAVLFADTNKSISQSSGPEILERVRDAGAQPMVMKIPADKEQFFGVQVNLLNKDDIEYMICLELEGKPLSDKVFQALSACDISVGINQTEPVANQYGLIGVNPGLILTACFQNRLYDSVLCSRMNSNLDIGHYVGEIVHEMDL